MKYTNNSLFSRGSPKKVRHHLFLPLLLGVLFLCSDPHLMYNKAGNLQELTIGQNVTNYGYTGDLLTTVGVSNLTWNDNGQLTESLSANILYNWDGKLQSATAGQESISCKYDPDGNRIRKNSTVVGNRKYIVDIVGKLPVVLLVIEPTAGTIENSFHYANAQTLRQTSGTDKYYYLHDRLGSVRAFNQILKKIG